MEVQQSVSVQCASIHWNEWNEFLISRSRTFIMRKINDFAHTLNIKALFVQVIITSQRWWFLCDDDSQAPIPNMHIWLIFIVSFLLWLFYDWSREQCTVLRPSNCGWYNPIAHLSPKYEQYKMLALAPFNVHASWCRSFECHRNSFSILLLPKYHLKRTNPNFERQQSHSQQHNKCIMCSVLTTRSTLS